MKLFFLKSSSYNPWFNLGLEEYFFRNLPDESVLFYLWQNKNTVVIGRTQNAWKECRIAALEESGGKLARRSSGGGAVYHDLGNLCYTFIGKGGTYNLEKQLKTILDGVKKLNIDASFTGRNDITADGRKFSGNAFKFEKDTGLMHGTLLVDTDGTKLASFLSVSKAKLNSKGVASVRSRVVNLKEINSEITIEGLKIALTDSFKENYGEFIDLGTYGLNEATNGIDISEISDNAYTYNFVDFTAINQYYGKYSSWDFRLGENPSFDINFEKHFDWGTVEFNFNSANGCISKAGVFTDANNPDFAEILTATLEGIVFSPATICEKITELLPTHITEQMCKDMQDLVKEYIG